MWKLGHVGLLAVASCEHQEVSPRCPHRVRASFGMPSSQAHDTEWSASNEALSTLLVVALSAVPATAAASLPDTKSKRVVAGRSMAGV